MTKRWLLQKTCSSNVRDAIVTMKFDSHKIPSKWEQIYCIFGVLQSWYTNIWGLMMTLYSFRKSDGILRRSFLFPGFLSAQYMNS